MHRIYHQLYTAYGSQHWWPAKEGAFEVMVGAVLTQNTRWENVEKAIERLREARVLDAARILALAPDDLAELIRPAGFFRLKTKRLRAMCFFFFESGGMSGMQTQSLKLLRSQWLDVYGIGPETADSILLYAFSLPVFVVDAYTRRIFNRLGVFQLNDYHEVQQYFHSHLSADVDLFKEYHALIVQHAKQYCRTKPLCNTCPLHTICAYAC